MRTCLLGLVVLAACSGDDSGGPPVGMDGGGTFDAPPEMDAGPPPDDSGSLRRDGGRDSGTLRFDAGMMGCGPGEHMCTSGCEPDRPNEPAEGCRLGCGDFVCVGPEGGDAMCDGAGMCVTSCPAGAIEEGGVCCGGAVTCSDGIEALLACPRPSEEPNDTDITPRRLGGYDDEVGSAETLSGLALAAGDVDFFAFNVTDSCCTASTIVRVSVTTPLADTVELGAWFDCDSGSESHSCTAGTADATFGNGCAADVTGGAPATGRVELDLDCTGTLDENGTVLIRVQHAPGATMCLEYELDFEVTT